MVHIAKCECPALLQNRDHFVERSMVAFDMFVALPMLTKQDFLIPERLPGKTPGVEPERRPVKNTKRAPKIRQVDRSRAAESAPGALLSPI
eukprot:3939515-Rhodomonas_salina.1